MTIGILGCGGDYEYEVKMLSIRANVICCESFEDKMALKSVLNADGLIVGRNIEIDETFIAKLAKCKIIVRNGIGTNNIDIVAAANKGIKVKNVPDYCLSEVADHTLALYLSYARRIIESQEALRAGKATWGRFDGNIRRLSGQNIGIYGLGRIGSKVAKRFLGFDASIYYFDPNVEKSEYVRVNSLSELVAKVDVLCIHVPLTENTKYSINSELLSIAKPGLTIINCARGKIVDTKAIYNGLKQGIIEAYLTDVWEKEPPKEDILFKDFISKGDLSNRIVVTNHYAFHSEESANNLHEKTVDTLLHYLDKEDLN